MNKLYALLSLVCLTGCAEVAKVATVVTTDPNTVAAAKAVVVAAGTAVTMSYPEVIAVSSAGVALVTAATALYKALKK